MVPNMKLSRLFHIFSIFRYDFSFPWQQMPALIVMLLNWIFRIGKYFSLEMTFLPLTASLLLCFSNISGAILLVAICHRKILKPFLEAKFKLNHDVDTSKPNNNEQMKTDTEFQKQIVLELKKEMMEHKLSMIAELNKMQSETLNQFINQQKKSNNESREGVKKMLLNHLDAKFGESEIELKKSQTQQFADIKNQQKQQNQKIEKQNEEFVKQCKDLQKVISNQTKQQGFLQNLVLDLKGNSNGKSQEVTAKIENEDVNHECKICLDKALAVALRPCGHIAVCEDCEEKLPKKCPICRKLIVGTLRVYFP